VNLQFSNGLFDVELGDMLQLYNWRHQTIGIGVIIGLLELRNVVMLTADGVYSVTTKNQHLMRRVPRC
jgi:hypothetical protein